MLKLHPTIIKMKSKEKIRFENILSKNVLSKRILEEDLREIEFMESLLNLKHSNGDMDFVRCYFAMGAFFNKWYIDKFIYY